LLALSCIALAVALVAVASSPSRNKAAAAALQRSAVANDGVPASAHVFLIVGENTSLSQITPGHAPYLSQSLKPQAAWLTNYRSFKKSSSLGQYIAMVSGQFTKCEANNDLPVHCHQRINNLFQQLDHTGRSWFDWQQSMDNACDYVDHGSAWAKNIYSAHHNPALYFIGIEGGHYDEAITPKAECLQRNLSTGTTAPNDTTRLDATLANGGVGNFNMIVPNDCENGHDVCGTHDAVRQFDDFLAREIPRIEGSPAFGPDGLILITWDEGADPPKDPTHVLTVAIGPRVKPGVYSGSRANHYSMLRTVEDAFALPHLANAKRARTLGPIWR
jgi:hypothetical protein